MLRRTDERFAHGACSLHREESTSSMMDLERTRSLRCRTMQTDLMSTCCSEILILPSKETVVRYFLSRTSLNQDSVIAMIIKDIEMDVEVDDLD